MMDTLVEGDLDTRTHGDDTMCAGRQTAETHLQAKDGGSPSCSTCSLPGPGGRPCRHPHLTPDFQTTEFLLCAPPVGGPGAQTQCRGIPAWGPPQLWRWAGVGST